MFRKPASGYTLIELLVTVTMVTLLFTLGYAGFRQFSQRQQISGVAKSILSDLRTIQQKATTGEKPAGATCTVLHGYAFVYVSSTSYDLRADCSNNPDITVKSVTLPTSITMTVSNNRTLFKVLGLGTDLAADNVITVIQSVTGYRSLITVGIGGDIK